ncbi:MAG: hypothetical protein KA715_06195 [Xanthomonadaceae bacterium]|nr:hypothetical protein [Xanthomonadaceae bacterium]
MSIKTIGLVVGLVFGLNAVMPVAHAQFKVDPKYRKQNLESARKCPVPKHAKVKKIKPPKVAKIKEPKKTKERKPSH